MKDLESLFVDGKNQIPSFTITPNIDKKIILIDLIESELELEHRPPGEIRGRVDRELLNKNKKR